MAVKSSDQVTILDITDAYSPYLSSEAYTFLGDTSYALAGTCTTQVSCKRGSEDMSVHVGTVVCPANSGVTAAVSNNDTAAVTVTFTVAANKVNAPVECSIPLTVDNGTISFTKKFSIGVSLKGTTGAQGGKGDTGPQGPRGPQGETGQTGAAGADAITISITSDNGTIFKNDSGSTTLTAHVYKAGKELSSTEIAALGTLKWYKGTATTATATGATCSVSASAVTNKETYTVKLEG